MTDTVEPPAENYIPAALYGAPQTIPNGQAVLHPTRDAYFSVVENLKAEGFEMASDVTAVDYLALGNGRPPVPASVTLERFEVVVTLLSLSQKRRIRLRVQVPESSPYIASLFDLYPGTEAMEREVFDLMGIRFENHPDLTRILMPEDWEGHPLRKDYSQGRIPVQFKFPEGKYSAEDRP